MHAPASLDRPGPSAWSAAADGSPVWELPEGVAAATADVLAAHRGGFLVRHAPDTGVLRDSTLGWSVEMPGGRRAPVGFERGAPVGVAALRPLSAVEVTWSSVRDPLAHTRLVVALAAAGVPLVSGPLPRWAEHLLGRPLARLVGRAPGPWAPLERETHSIRLRRAVERAAPAGPEPEVGVVLCSRRPGMLRHAVEQVAGQRGVRPVLVIALHGVERLPDDARGALDDSGLAADVAVHGADEVFGDVLTAAVRRAGTDLVTKWDDDDWYGPHHLRELRTALTTSGAAVVGCNAEFVHLEALDVTVARQSVNELPTTHVAGGTITARRETVEDLGGFPSLASGVDAGLLAAATAAGATIYRTHAHNMVLRRSRDGHTWDPGVDYFLDRAYHQTWGRAGGPAMTDADDDRRWV
ncbi:hypothetical protein [Aquipuribacter nitratireducens]|uniref:Glycosyl transferase family 2 n=1 Tax=Aquipuribacter nitratireducens TaxID=650104 RepID=A0ABW0GK86_9MICO